jgi:tetratricopeptide (TPR) repeat protein
MNESAINILKTLNKYKVIIGIGIGVAIAISVGVSFLVTAKTRKIESEWQNIRKINNDLATAMQQGREEKDKTAALTTAADAYKYVRDNVSSSSTLPWVLFQLGNIYHKLKNYDEAIRHYNDFLDKYGSHQLAPVVKQSLGYCYEEKGLFPEAIRQFENVSGHKDGLLTAQNGWDAGRCYEKLGQTSDAIRSYTKAIELFPNSVWATMSQYRLSAIK